MSEEIQQTEANKTAVDSQTETGLPSDEGVKLTVEEQLEQARQEAEKYKKMHQEAEKLIGKKGQEEGERRKQEQEQQTQAEREALKEKFYEESLRDFIDNGMGINEELSAKLNELEISPEAYKLKAYEYRDNMSKLYNQAGSQEAYTEIMTWAKDNVQLSKEELAIVGLKAIYQSVNQTDGKPAPRVEGHSSNTPANRGYSSRSEVSKDLAYLRVNPNDKGAFEAYRAKLARTPEGIL